ncbi:MAG: biotin-independent malonate decarboxylase subunit gamma [Burkholderiales bacterium RIFCSPHIGHO2_12_FULL_61_11]|nr:MAG: biotin-independent malonate decarboxylase subunit gamma [Burkholderiales bacterium RIFCSPHIGHO2_12_FULL_61_11]
MLEDEFFQGSARVGGTDVSVLGTARQAEIGVDLALRMASVVLDTVRNHAGRPLLFLLDTQGQRLRRRDELLGLNGFMAHLAKCMEIARSRGHISLSVVYGEAVSGGYLTTGMMADACYALADAEIKVMNLPAMSRITKIPLERLEALAGQSPVFSPGVANYLRMGHLRSVWAGNYAACLASALDALQSMPVTERALDTRMRDGLARGGRSLAATVVARVLGHA